MDGISNGYTIITKDELQPWVYLPLMLYLFVDYIPIAQRTPVTMIM